MHAAKASTIPKAKGHWLLGSAEDFARAPHAFVADLARENGGIAQFRVMHKRFLATSSPEIAHHVFVSRRERWKRGYYNRKLGVIIGQGLLATEDDLWRRRHDIIQPLLRRSEAAQLVPVVQRAATKMLDAWEAKRRLNEPVSAGREALGLALDVIAQRMLSIDLDPVASAQFGESMREALLLLRQRNTSIVAAPMWCRVGRNARLAEYRDDLDRFFARHIDDREANGQPDAPDVLSALMATRDPATNEALPRQALIDETKTLFMAGYETTAAAMTWTLFLIAQHPEVAEIWREELGRVVGDRLPQWEDIPRLIYTAQILNESMRLYPPVYNVARECIEDDEIGQYHIARKSTMLISIYGIHRSESWGADADAFRPERFAPDAACPRRSFLPFAAGEHLCVGNHVALTQLLIALAMVGQKYRLTRVNDERVEASPRITLTPTREILLRLEPWR